MSGSAISGAFSQTILWLLILLSTPLSVAAPGADAADENWQSNDGWSSDNQDDDDWGDDDWSNDSQSAAGRWHWSGFTELGLGRRLEDDPVITTDTTLQELRQRLEVSYSGMQWQLRIKADLIGDGVTDQLESNIRQAELALSPSEAWDLKLGRQVLTWGTGRYLFLNDLFPKDWQSFFAGRDDEYLKAPANALKASYFGSAFNLDLVWMPEFRSDRFINGERFSFFDRSRGLQIAPDPPAGSDKPGSGLNDGELAARLFRTVGAVEYALYGYRGYWKTPLGICSSGNPCHPRLNVWGGSARGPLGPGVGNIEAAWFDSREDNDGDNPNIPNDQIRLLLGYEQELRPRLTGGAQYYLEWTRDFGALKRNQADEFLPEEYRQLWTLSLDYRSPRDTLKLGLFLFWSPSDEDYYLRPTASYRIDDAWQLSGGFNWLGGDRPHTQFSQMADGSNGWLRLRYHY